MMPKPNDAIQKPVRSAPNDAVQKPVRSAPDAPRRRMLSGATVKPSIEMFRSEHGDRWVALLRYNKIIVPVTHKWRDDARDIAEQFYMTHSAEGKANSEVVPE